MTATPDRPVVSKAVNPERVHRFLAKPLDEEEVFVGMMDLLKRRHGRMGRIPPTRR